jgi:DNA (cytosine-5)-methyltransferase 1
MTIMEKINVFETFAGIGAQHKALEILKTQGHLDYEIVATSEWDIWAIISYNAIHHDGRNIATNLTDEEINEYLSRFTFSFDSKVPFAHEKLIRQDRLTRELLYSGMKNANNQGSITEILGTTLIENVKEKNIDLITYSFPCQDLSVAGSFHGFNQGMKKGSGTRSGLLWEIERILKELKTIGKLPKYLLLENVKNMLSNKHIDDYKEWISFLKDMGYNTKTFILDALNYGIPQHRERVYALSILDDEEYDDTYSATNQNQIVDTNGWVENMSSEIGVAKKMNNILKTNYTNKMYFEEARLANPNRTPSRKRMFDDNYLLYTNDEAKLKRQKRIPINNEYIKTRSGFYLSYCRTITTKQDRNPNAGVIDLAGTVFDTSRDRNKAKYRFLTNREAYLLMGFDDGDFGNIKKMNLRKDIMYRQAGNSIVVNVLISIFYFMVKQKWREK